MFEQFDCKYVLDEVIIKKFNANYVESLELSRSEIGIIHASYVSKFALKINEDTLIGLLKYGWYHNRKSVEPALQLNSEISYTYLIDEPYQNLAIGLDINIAQYD
eukprot:68836_1